MITVVFELPPRVSASGKSRRLFRCKCDCGVLMEVLKQNIAQTTGCRSCGHKGKPAPNRTHGMSRTPLFRLWKQMRQRCNNPRDTSYKRYGGRGIRVCERWSDFSAFAADMGPRPEGMTIDRIDTDGPYGPENCHWATDTEQARNKSNNRKLTIAGVTKCLAEWEQESPVTYFAILHRIRSGWSVEDAVRLPAGARGDGRIKPGDQLRLIHGRRARKRSSAAQGGSE